MSVAGAELPTAPQAASALFPLLAVPPNSIGSVWSFSGSQGEQLQDYVTSPKDFKFDRLLRLLNNAVRQKTDAR
jgi:hypothetical protein